MYCVLRNLLVIWILTASPAALANDMIGNSASGSVGGSIIQTASDSSVNIINVGSIVSDNAHNISVSGHVEGDIVVHTSGRGATTLNIGSYIEDAP